MMPFNNNMNQYGNNPYWQYGNYGSYGNAQPQQPQYQTGSIQYVNGIDSARAYQLAPNQSILLMDSSLPRFYVKTTDASGFATIKAYDFKEAKENQQDEEYLTKAEFNSWLSAFESKNAHKKGSDRNESTSK